MSRPTGIGARARTLRLGQAVLRPGPRSRPTVLSAAASSMIIVLLVGTSLGSSSRLGVSGVWPWLLTGLQVLSLWAAGAGRWWGWPLGASVQPPWIVYAILTGKWGFIPGCAISAVVQTRSYLRRLDEVPNREKPHRRLRLRGFSERPHQSEALADLVIQPFPAYVASQHR